MPNDKSSWLSGRLLAAMPGIEDPRFERAVIILCAHDADHAMGLAVNRPVEGLTIGHLLTKLGVTPTKPAPSDLVLMGGPVEPERGFVLHTSDYANEGSSISVTDGVMLTATREVLEAIARSDHPPRRSTMALGYASWQAGQLEREILDNVWLTCEPDEGLIFDDDHVHKWSRALAKIGVAAEHLSHQAGRA